MCQLSRSGELEHLTPERVWREMEKALKADYPVRFFEELRACGALKILFPEIEELYGVPQPAKYHPEIDCGVHVMMVLEQSVRLSSDPLVRFAALCHDLGKANTPEDILPSHRGHELRGVKRLKKLCERFRIPKNYCEIASLTAQYHTHCHKVEELKPSTILKVLQAFDIYRRPERLEIFLLACTADTRGRTGFEECEYPQADRFRLARDAAVSVKSADFVKQGIEGKALGEAIQKQRVHEISIVMNKR
jgi:tRNA nucleotidyltransferase (CCA-adding enzyme)